MNAIDWLRARFGGASASSGDDGGRPGPTDDFWYQPIGGPNSSGVRVTHDNAIRVTTVLACIKAISGAIGSLPLAIFERQDNGDKIRRDRHPLFDVLHTQSNDEQTAVEYREQILAWALMRGTAISEIVPGRRGAVDQLVPLHPDHVTPQRVEDLAGRYRWIFHYRPGRGEPARTLLRDEVFIVRGLGLGPDTVIGLDPITAEANAIGAALAANDYAGRFFANDARPSGIIKHPATLKDQESVNRLRSAWERMFRGAGRHRTAVLDQGMEWQGVAVTNEQAQFLETRQYNDVDVCRIFGIQPHKVGILDRATFSNIEQQALEFVTDTLRPWLVRFEQAVSRDLILRSQYFAEHNVAGLLRGDLESRYQSYAIGRNWGWLSANDIRRLENMNSIGGDGDVYLQPLNMVPAGEPGDPSSQGAPRRRDATAARGMTQRRTGLWAPSSIQ